MRRREADFLCSQPEDWTGLYDFCYDEVVGASFRSGHKIQVLEVLAGWSFGSGKNQTEWMVFWRRWLPGYRGLFVATYINHMGILH